MKLRLVLFLIVFLGVSTALFFELSVGLSRIKLLQELATHGAVTEGILKKLPAAHGSGPKPAEDWGYTFSINNQSFEGYVRAGGPFRIPLGTNSISDLATAPIVGEKVPVTYMATDPSRNTPFLVTHNHSTFAKIVLIITASVTILIGGGIFWLIRVIL